MSNFRKTASLRSIALLVFCAMTMPLGTSPARSDSLNLSRTSLDKDQVIPPSEPPPSTTSNQRRGGDCSEMSPRVLLPPSAAADPSPQPVPLIKTTARYPTFLFHLPPTSARRAEFVLKNADRQTIYRRILDLNLQSGILRLEVPKEQLSQEILEGQTYTWEFKTICNPQDRTLDDLVAGKLERSPLTPSQAAGLAQASAREQLALFGNIGADYDAGVLLDALRRNAPNNRALQAAWEDWLEKSQLGDLRKAPVIDVE